MIVPIWGKNMLGYLSLDIICSSKLTVFLLLRSCKLFASKNRLCLRTNILAYFPAKWRLLFIYSQILKTVLEKDDKHNSLYLAQKYARIYSLDIIRSLKLTVFLKLPSLKTVCFSEQIMFKYYHAK